MITIKDVARLAGVSISTVSRVINDSKPVSPEARKKVLKIIEETGYKPNDVARSLVTKKSYLIGVIINNLANTYVADIVRGIEEIGKMYDYDILLCSSYFSKDAQQKYIQLLNRKQAEGIILVGYDFDNEIIEQVKQLNKPYMFYTRNAKDKMNCIGIDNYKAAYEMTSYLIEKGHKKIAYLSNLENKSNSEKEKIKGYESALEDNGISDSIIYTAGGRRYNHSYDTGKKIAKDIEKISAIFCSNDELAIGLVNSFADMNIKTPEDVSVVGYGNYKECQYVRPELTTIAEPFYDIGAVSIRTIIKAIKNKKEVEDTVQLPYTLIERKSVKDLNE